MSLGLSPLFVKKLYVNCMMVPRMFLIFIDVLIDATSLNFRCIKWVAWDALSNCWLCP